jgi:hypothetical protein
MIELAVGARSRLQGSMKTNLIGVVVGVAIAIAATTASACTKDYPAGADQVVPARIDQNLLDAVSAPR